MIKVGDRVRVIGNSYGAGEYTLGKYGVVSDVESKSVVWVNLDGEQISWGYAHKDLEVIPEESHPQLLNSSYTEQVEDILNQLRETIKSSSLPYNSWRLIYAEGVDTKIGELLAPLRELSTELRKYERAQAKGEAYDS